MMSSQVDRGFINRIISPAELETYEEQGTCPWAKHLPKKDSLKFVTSAWTSGTPKETCHIQVLASHAEDEMLRRLPADSTAAEHARIIENIAANRPVAAERAAEEHLRNAMRNKEDLLGVRLEDLPSSSSAL